MKLSKEAFRGTGHVFSFTLSQFFKSKANIITLVIMFILMLASFPLMSLLMAGDGSSVAGSGSGDAADSGITRIYYSNESGYEIPFNQIAEQDVSFAGAEVTEADFAAEAYAERLTETEALVTVTAPTDDVTGVSQIMVSVYCLNGKKEGFSLENKDEKDSFAKLQDAVTNLVEEARYAAVGADSTQLATVFSGYDTESETYSEYQDATKAGFAVTFAVQYAYSIVVLILTMFSTTYIVHSVVEEKASKLVETLMVSIKPLALIVGKILAVMAYVFGMILLLLAGAVISYFVSSQFMETISVSDMLAAAGMSMGDMHIGIGVVLMILFSLLLGYLIFSIIGGIAGTSCSFMEDMESANSTVVLLVMAGYMVSCFTTGMGSRTVGVVTSLIPFVSVFSAPVQYVFGNISFGVLCLSWLIQIVMIVLLAAFCARIYGALIMHRGRKLKLSDLIGLARGKVIKEEA